MQRNPHSYQIATGYRTFYSLSLIYQPITKKRLFFNEKDTWLTFCHLSAFSVQQEGKVASVGIKCSAYGICREVWPEI